MKEIIMALLKSTILHMLVFCCLIYFLEQNNLTTLFILAASIVLYRSVLERAATFLLSDKQADEDEEKK